MNKKIPKNTAAYLRTGTKAFLIIVIALLSVMVFTSCIRITGLRGSGNVITQQRDVLGFDSVSVSSGMNLYIEQTKTESLMIEAESNIVPKILTEVKNGELIIRYKPWTMGFGGIITNEPVNVYLTVKDISAIEASSGSTLDCSALSSDNLVISLSSGTEGIAAVKVTDLEINLSSGSSLEVTGTAITQDANLSSGVNYNAEDLLSENARVDVSSGAVADINASKSLDVDISSGGVVRYIGSPQIISDISSGGTLKNISGD